ncbi:MAG TPA: hypothetical protein VJ853_04105 [Thermoanaerobaculia bacterium]|nr:hypothetical protein [Thermoanaerobaculia bacterium]
MTTDLFEYVRVSDSVPAAERGLIDVAVLDMNHSWPNVGHASVIRAICDATESSREMLRRAGAKVRAISFDVRRKGLLPAAPDGQFMLYLGTGGPGHLDPRLNDGESEWSQGVNEQGEWEAPLFRLFDAIFSHPHAALIGICHSFGLMCRWSGVARPVLREEKSSGFLSNILSEGAAHHPWFSRFAASLPDHKHFRVIDNRLFDLILDDSRGVNCLAFENENSAAVTMLEFARDAEDEMPRVFGMNHHPEIIDREHVLEVLEEKRSQGEVSERWYRERADTMTDLLQGENERQSRLTSEFTFIGPLRHHIAQLIEERCGVGPASAGLAG